jgi:hypothetical protein
MEELHVSESNGGQEGPKEGLALRKVGSFPYKSVAKTRTFGYLIRG